MTRNEALTKLFQYAVPLNASESAAFIDGLVALGLLTLEKEPTAEDVLNKRGW